MTDLADPTPLITMGHFIREELCIWAFMKTFVIYEIEKITINAAIQTLTIFLIYHLPYGSTVTR